MAKDVRIVAAKERNTFIGLYAFDVKKRLHILTNASVVRSWGTSAGLGQLALQGKQERTVLDFAGAVVLPDDAVIAMIKCDPAHWDL